MGKSQRSLNLTIEQKTILLKGYKKHVNLWPVFSLFEMICNSTQPLTFFQPFSSTSGCALLATSRSHSFHGICFKKLDRFTFRIKFFHFYKMVKLFGTFFIKKMLLSMKRCWGISRNSTWSRRRTSCPSSRRMTTTSGTILVRIQWEDVKEGCILVLLAKC